MHLESANSATVASSTGERVYTLTWSDDRRTYSSNDNASYWHGEMGYPIIAVALALGQLPYDPAIAQQLAGIRWKALVDAARHDYEAALTAALAQVEARGGDRQAITAQAEAIYADLLALDLQRGRRGAPPPRVPAPPAPPRITPSAEERSAHGDRLRHAPLSGHRPKQDRRDDE